MLSRLFRTNSVVGIDAGSSRVAVVEVEEGRSGKGRRIRRYGSAPTPPGAYVAGVVHDPAALGGAIREAVREAGIRTRDAALAIQPQVAFLRKFSFPQMPLSELRKVIALQPERYIPFAREGAQYDLDIIPPAPGEEQMTAVLAAAPTKAVEDLMLACRTAGMKPRTIDLEPLALYRAAVASGRVSQDEGVCLVDMGTALAKISLFDGPVPFVSRVVEMPRSDTEHQSPFAGVETEALFLDIRRSLEFALTQTRTPPSRVLVTGGHGTDEYLAISLTAYLLGYLSHRLPANFRVEPLDPGDLGLPPGYMLAFGLSLSQEGRYDQNQSGHQAQAN